MLGDYIYTGENFKDGVAKKYAEFCFNEASNNPDLKASVPLIGALTNYFASCYTIDEKVRNDSRFYIADKITSDPNEHRLNIGVSTKLSCVLEKNHFLDMSLTSDESLTRSRTNKYNDLYRLMMISFHELTHDHQKNMMEAGENSSTAMSYILRNVLNRGSRQCFQKPLSNGSTRQASYYKANHDNDEIEIEADEEAWVQCRAFLVKHQKEYAERTNNQELAQKCFERREKCAENRQTVSDRRIFTKKLAETGEQVSSVQYDMVHLKEYVANEPALLNKYPQLRNFVEPSGDFNLGILFDEKIARVDYSNNYIDAHTDVFGVEVGSYMLTNKNEVSRVANSIKNNSNNLSDAQIKNLFRNIYHVAHQDVLKTRQLKNIDTEKYDETKALGKDTPIEELGTNLFKQYLQQAYYCTYLAETVRKSRPELAEYINKEMNEAFNNSYYNEMSANGQLSKQYAQNAFNSLTRTRNPVLLNLARRLQQDYGLSNTASN